jgi:hypothetical protein
MVSCLQASSWRLEPRTSLSLYFRSVFEAAVLFCGDCWPARRTAPPHAARCARAVLADPKPQYKIIACCSRAMPLTGSARARGWGCLGGPLGYGGWGVAGPGPPTRTQRQSGTGRAGTLRGVRRHARDHHARVPAMPAIRSTQSPPDKGGR